MAELRRLGARSVPVVARGEKYVFAQLIGDVVKFLGLQEKTGPELPAEELARRLDMVLEAHLRYVRQMPESALERELPPAAVLRALGYDRCLRQQVPVGLDLDAGRAIALEGDLARQIKEQELVAAAVQAVGNRDSYVQRLKEYSDQFPQSGRSADFRRVMEETALWEAIEAWTGLVDE